MSIVDNVKKNFGQIKVTRSAEGESIDTEIRSVNDVVRYLAAVREQADRMEAGEIKGDIEADVKVTTATEIERREYLNYCLNLVSDKYIKHKILLFLRVNPFKENPTTGRGLYLSKKEIARALTDRCGFKVLENDVTTIEREAVQMVTEAIASSKQSGVPLVGTNEF